MMYIYNYFLSDICIDIMVQIRVLELEDGKDYSSTLFRVQKGKLIIITIISIWGKENPSCTV